MMIFLLSSNAGDDFSAATLSFLHFSGWPLVTGLSFRLGDKGRVAV